MGQETSPCMVSQRKHGRRSKHLTPVVMGIKPKGPDKKKGESFLPKIYSLIEHVSIVVVDHPPRSRNAREAEILPSTPQKHGMYLI